MGSRPAPTFVFGKSFEVPVENYRRKKKKEEEEEEEEEEKREERRSSRRKEGRKVGRRKEKIRRKLNSKKGMAPQWWPHPNPTPLTVLPWTPCTPFRI